MAPRTLRTATAAACLLLLCLQGASACYFARQGTFQPDLSSAGECAYHRPLGLMAACRRAGSPALVPPRPQAPAWVCPRPWGVDGARLGASWIGCPGAGAAAQPTPGFSPASLSFEGVARWFHRTGPASLQQALPLAPPAPLFPPHAGAAASRRALQQARLVNGAGTCTNANTGTPYTPPMPAQGTADSAIRERECLPCLFLARCGAGCRAPRRLQRAGQLTASPVPSHTLRPVQAVPSCLQRLA